MKTAILFATALVSGMSLLLAAQQPAAGVGQNSAVSSQIDQSATAQGAARARISPLAYGYMRPVVCELAGKLDTKSAKAGDAVVAKTKHSVRMPDDTIIPKGAKLVGHIADIQAHTSDHTDSHLSIAFDRVEWSGGHSIPILSVIQAVNPPPNLFASSSAQNSDPLAGPIGAGSPGMIGARTGGGMPGGTAAGAPTTGNLSSNVGGIASSGGSLPRAAGQTTDGMAGNAGSARDYSGPVAGIGMSAASSASMGIHPTGVSGVMLAGDPTGETAGTLSSSNRNVHLDSGAELTVAVSTAASQ